MVVLRSGSGLSLMKEKNKSTFKCLVSVGRCRHWLIFMHTCCGCSSHETGPDPPWALPQSSHVCLCSQARLHLIRRVLLHGGCLCTRTGKGQEVSRLSLSSRQWCSSILLGKCWRLARQSPWGGSAGPCCGVRSLHPISMDWLEIGGDLIPLIP